MSNEGMSWQIWSMPKLVPGLIQASKNRSRDQFLLPKMVQGPFFASQNGPTCPILVRVHLSGPKLACKIQSRTKLQLAKSGPGPNQFAKFGPGPKLTSKIQSRTKLACEIWSRTKQLQNLVCKVWSRTKLAWTKITQLVQNWSQSGKITCPVIIQSLNQQW